MRTYTCGLLFMTVAVSMTSATSAGVRQKGIENGRLTDSRPRRDVMGYGMPGDEEYGGRFTPLNKRPFGSLFNKGVGKRSEFREEEEEEIIPEEDNDSPVPVKRLQSILGGGFKLGKRPSRGNDRGSSFSLGRRHLGGILGGGYKFGKRSYGGVLGGGYKFGKRGFGGILGGGYKFGKRGMGGVLSGGYKFGKRDDESDDMDIEPEMDDRLELAKRPWGNLFNKGFQLGKRDSSGRDFSMADIYRALMSRRYPGEGSYESGPERANVMRNAVSVAKRLFGSVLSNGYKLG